MRQRMDSCKQSIARGFPHYQGILHVKQWTLSLELVANFFTGKHNLCSSSLLVIRQQLCVKEYMW